MRTDRMCGILSHHELDEPTDFDFGPKFIVRFLLPQSELGRSVMSTSSGTVYWFAGSIVSHADLL